VGFGTASTPYQSTHLARKKIGVEAVQKNSDVLGGDSQKEHDHAIRGTMERGLAQPLQSATRQCFPMVKELNCWYTCVEPIKDFE